MIVTTYDVGSCTFVQESLCAVGILQGFLMLKLRHCKKGGVSRCYKTYHSSQTSRMDLHARIPRGSGGRDQTNLMDHNTSTYRVHFRDLDAVQEDSEVHEGTGADH